MKIFISHSSKNKEYGNEFVDLLTGVSVSGEDIIFTSNDAYGIPIGENIFQWLKSRIAEKPHVIYLLSPEYYQSVACLNEMGAAWVIENKHTMIFTLDFQLNSYEFQNGAIDPREIGFYINNQNKLIAFIDSLRNDFNITKNQVLINQKISIFLENIKPLNTKPKVSNNHIKTAETNTLKTESKVKTETDSIKTKNVYLDKKSENSRLLTDLWNGKLEDEEVLLLHYIIDTARFKLGTGWQESQETENIKTWEDIHELNDTLSRNYSKVLRILEIKKLTVVSALSGYGNPKEVKIIETIQDVLLNLPSELDEKIKEVIKINPKQSGW
jgi:hypothetical protein